MGATSVRQRIMTCMYGNLLPEHRSCSTIKSFRMFLVDKGATIAHFISILLDLNIALVTGRAGIVWGTVLKCSERVRKEEQAGVSGPFT